MTALLKIGPGCCSWRGLPHARRRPQRRLLRLAALFRGLRLRPAESEAARGGPSLSLALVRRFAAATLTKPKELSFSHLQVLTGLVATGAVAKVTPVSRAAGAALVTLCVGVSLSGYARCLYLTRGRKCWTQAVLEAHEVAKTEYDAGAPSADSHEWNRFLLSPFYEPSLIYLTLNCWGLYAVAQCTLCPTLGGTGLLLLCGAAFFVGRSFQSLLKFLSPVQYSREDGERSVMGQLVEMLLLPKGTWGFGPLLSTLIWFSCFACPTLAYPATPTGVMAPLWTAAGIPLLLLCEDVLSLLHNSRRSQKIANGSAPGLQLAAVLVGFCGACLLR